jgi:hypothetical protein
MIAADPQGVVSVFSTDDFPSYLMGKSAGVITRTTIDPTGRPLKCELEVSSGEAKLDKHTCDIIMQRAKFQPARWLDGSPAMGVIRLPVVWASDKLLTSRPDIELSVDRLPPKLKPPVKVHLIVAVDRQGQIVDCQGRGLPESKANQHPTPQLIDLACAEARRGWSAIAARDSAGAAQRSIQNLSVHFLKTRLRS